MIFKLILFLQLIPNIPINLCPYVLHALTQNEKKKSNTSFYRQTSEQSNKEPRTRKGLLTKRPKFYFMKTKPTS